MHNLLLILLATLLNFFGGPEEVTIVFAGDAMQHQSQLDAARAAGGGKTYDYTDCFAEISPYVKSADYAVVNLETTLGSSGFTGYPCFCSPDSYARALKEAGFDMMLTANNHTLDRSDAGLKRTVAVLDSLGVAHLGTYTNAAERRGQLPMLVDINGFNVGFLNYTYGTNGIKVKGDAVVDYIEDKLIADDIARLREAGAEVITVAIHWGDEYKLTPNEAQKRRAKKLLDLGVDLVIGSHPHVIQPIEIIENQSVGNINNDADNEDMPTRMDRSLVVYSLGNFISGMKTRDTRGGIMVRVTLNRDNQGRPQLKAVEYLPVFTLFGKSGSNFKLVPVDTYKGSYMQSEMKMFNDSATGIFNKHNKGSVVRSTYFIDNK